VPRCRDLKCNHGLLSFGAESRAALGQAIGDLCNLLDYAIDL